MRFSSSMTLDLKSDPSYLRSRSNSILFPERYWFICLAASLSASVSHWSIEGRLLQGRYTPVIIPSPSSEMLTVPISVRNDQMHAPRMTFVSASPYKEWVTRKSITNSYY